VLDAVAGVLTGVCQSARRHDMHRASKQIRQISLQRCLLEEAGSVTHVNEHIGIAPRSRVPAGNRAEDADSQSTMRARHDLIVAAAELLEARGWPSRPRVGIGWTAALDLSAEVAKPAQLRVFFFSGATHTPQGVADELLARPRSGTRT
jgi:hypothetical protein